MTDEPEQSVDDRSSSRHVVSFAVQMSVSLRGVDDGRPSFETAGRTINLSRDGMLARIGEHLPIERRCLVQFPESGHRIANPEVHGVIVRCDPVEDGVAVAVEFETPLEFTRSSED